MALKRFDTMKVKEGRETIFKEYIGYAKGEFKEDVRRYANGLLNSHGGVIYFGVTSKGIIKGKQINRREEDEYRLSVDHVFGSFQPFVSIQHYRYCFLSFVSLSFLPVNKTHTVIELKVSIGELGEIYEDGNERVYVVDSTTLIGPLHPQELKELILLKYKQSIEGAEEAAKYCTPNLSKARMVAKTTKEKTMSSLSTTSSLAKRNSVSNSPRFRIPAITSQPINSSLVDTKIPSNLITNQNVDKYGNDRSSSSSSLPTTSSSSKSSVTSNANSATLSSSSTTSITSNLFSSNSSKTQNSVLTRINESIKNLTNEPVIKRAKQKNNPPPGKRNCLTRRESNYTYDDYYSQQQYTPFDQYQQQHAETYKYYSPYGGYGDWF